MPELYPDPVEGPYTVPSGTDIADGPQAFRDFADSLGGLSDTLEIVEIAGDHTATAVEMGSLFTYSGLDSPTLTIDAGLAPVGSVFAVSNLSDAADSALTVDTPNLTETVGQYAIMSFTQVAVDVWVPNGGGAGGCRCCDRHRGRCCAGGAVPDGRPFPPSPWTCMAACRPERAAPGK